MRRQGLVARDSRRRRRRGSYAGEVSSAPAPNLLPGGRGHDFSADAPNRRWVTDITQMRFAGGKLYWSVVVDLFDGRLVAARWSLSPDNAACEAFFGRMKVEMYRGRDWRSAEELGAALDAYGAWHNSERLKSWPEEGRRGRPSYETIDGRRRRLGLAAGPC